MKHKHKACTRTNNQKYAAAVFMSEWKISIHSPKHRLVLVGIKDNHKACTRTNNKKYTAAIFFVRIEGIKTFTQAQASASWYETQAQSMY